MTTKLNPYLNFSAGTREVMDFYASVFGGDPKVTTFAEAGGMGLDESEQEKVMHSQLDTAGGLTIMAADVPAHMGEPGPHGTISLSGEDDAELRGYWDRLSADGTVVLPLEKAPWGDRFGMCKDRFGVEWMVNIVGS